MTGKFGTALTCIDGRVQEPVARWLREHYYLDYIDVISEPGVDALLAAGDSPQAAWVREKVQRSLQRHGSNLIAVVGHYDCSANSGTQAEHAEQIRRALQAVRLWGFSATVEGLWVNETWEVEVVGG